MNDDGSWKSGAGGSIFGKGGCIYEARGLLIWDMFREFERHRYSPSCGSFERGV